MVFNVFIIICKVFHQINTFIADFFGSMQHYDKVINITKPDPEQNSTCNESIPLCGKLATKLKLLYLHNNIY